MGIKALKEHFGIHKHIVSVEDGVMCIGSDFVSKFVGIDMKTGELRLNETFSGFLSKEYPAVLEATNEERLALIQAQDKFSNSITVYTYNKGQIIEKQCEKFGFPNVTHDGEIMYENTHFLNIAHAVKYARQNIHYAIEHFEESIKDFEAKIAEKKRMLDEYGAYMEDLNKNYPVA